MPNHPLIFTEMMRSEI